MNRAPRDELIGLDLDASDSMALGHEMGLSCARCRKPFAIRVVQTSAIGE